MAKAMTDEERYGKVGAAIRRLDPEAYKNRPKTMEGNLKLLEELRSKAKEPPAAPAPRQLAARDSGPQRRYSGSQASRASAAMERNKSYLPSDRASGFRTQGEETGLDAAGRAEKARDYATNIALGASGAAGAGRLAASRAAKAAGDVGRAGSVNLRGMTMAEREREAAAAAEYAKRMKRMKETAEARSRMPRSTYKQGGAVKSSASRRADGIASKGKTRGKFV